MSDDSTPAMSSSMPPDAATSEAGQDALPPGSEGALRPYLAVAVLGLLAALIVLVQLWAYRDELRTILTQAPV
jgi:hypothetical protein